VVYLLYWFSLKWRVGKICRVATASTSKVTLSEFQKIFDNHINKARRYTWKQSKWQQDDE
jgi:hypothetical protein